MTSKEIGLSIRKVRKELGMTQFDFGCGLTRRQPSSQISNWENGICTPSALTLADIAESYNIPIGRLFGEKEREETAEELAKRAKAEYYRDWRKRNRDKVRMYHETYWSKRASEVLANA